MTCNREGRCLASRSKPLFRPDVLRPYLSAFEPPTRVDALRPKLRQWAELMASPRSDAFKEQEILPDFLTDFFCELLGYTRPADGAGRYTISRERHAEVDGKFADAVLGDFNGHQAHFLKAGHTWPRILLERPAAAATLNAPR